MFSLMKKVWAESELTSSIEGVLREAGKGNAREVQGWYFKFKKDAYKQSLKENLQPNEVEERALSKVEPAQAQLFLEVVGRLSRPGGVLNEIDVWLKNNRPL
jgi:hypothetical protein